MTQAVEGAPMSAPAALAESGPTTADGRTIVERYRFYILILLATTFGLNMADRGMVATLTPPIKAELGLTDAQVGLLIGPMFAVVYAIMGLPLATLADRHHRRNLLAATTSLFSAATAACGFAASYLHLAIARFFVGVGEAGTQPGANSIIADLYPANRRTGALAIYTAGGSCGMIIAGLVGGVVAHHYGWRMAFLVAGLPGLLLAALIFLTMPEPARVISRKLREQRTKVPLTEVLGMLWSQPAFRWIALGDIFLVFHNRGAGGFTSLFMVQTHGFNLQQLGIVHSVFGVASVFCVVAIGKLIDRLSNRDLRWLNWMPAIVSAVGIPASFVMLTASNGWVGLIVSGIGHLVGGAYLAPLLASTQSVVPNAMRARAVAVLVTLAMVVGMSLGPVVTGVMSDTLRAHVGHTEALRWSLILMLIPSVLGVLCLLKAATTLRANVARAQAIDGLA